MSTASLSTSTKKSGARDSGLAVGLVALVLFDNISALLFHKNPGIEPMTSNGFFDWIRQGVKQSVLLGVSDALETLGTVDSNEPYHPSIAKAIGAGLPKTDAPGVPNRAPRKRLGKSLKELNPEGVTKPKPSQETSS